jgi:hypothetical protein
MTNYDWEPRTEILERAHRWPVILLFVLAGSLLGALLAAVMPTPYRAEAGLQVTYNADVHPRNPDDWKNWQMEQLDILIHSDEVVGETLSRMQTRDPVWEQTTLEELRLKLHTYWRNAGEWRLVAESPSGDQAEELVTTWEQVILEQLNQALEQARAALGLSTRMDAISATLVDLKLKTAELEGIQRALNRWKDSATSANVDQPLTSLDRWQLTSQIARIAGWDRAGLALLEETPPENAPRSDYLPWVEKALVMTTQQMESIAPQSVQLQAEYDQLYAEQAVVLLASRGLTSYLTAEPLDRQEPPAKQVRSTAAMAFVGGILGFIAWCLWALAPPLRRMRVEPA